MPSLHSRRGFETGSSQTQATFTGIVVQDLTENSYGLPEFGIFASFDDASDDVLTVGNANIVSSTGFFHNSINGQGQSALPFTEAETAISDFPEADSFVTIGLFTGNNNATAIGLGFDEQEFINGNNLGASAAWANFDPFNNAGLAGPSGLVLLAVFTPTNDEFGNPGVVSGTLTVGYHVENGKSPQFGTATFITPAPGALALLVLAAMGGSRRRRDD